MGGPSSSNGFPLLRCFLPVAVVLVFLCSSSLSHQARSVGRDTHFFDVQVTSLIPSTEELSLCTPSPKAKGKNKEGITLEVVHRHGPCSNVKSTSKHPSSLNHSEILRHDQERVDSIHAKLSGAQSLEPKKVVLEGKSASLSTKSGSSIGSGNYIVSIGLGSPKRSLSLVFDTGSDLTWTQCKPCASTCYKQVEPIFDPAASTSYGNLSCASQICAELVVATGVMPRCSSTTACVYGIQYGDSSFSVGYLAKERLTLTPYDYLDGFVFGCGEGNQGLFGGSAGLLGLGRDKLSAVSQLAAKYGRYFSYCLPPGSTSAGHLTFGKGGTKARTFSYTSLLSSSKGQSFYFLELLGISVGGRRLSISPTVFSSAQTLIDSGTVITRLPPKAYSALSTAFKQGMTKYPSAPALSILDTCFDLSSYQVVSVPKVALYFRGGASMDLPLSGIVFAAKLSQVCLAFAGNSGDTSIAILGNTQQHSFDVVYDVDGGKIGFGPNGC